MYIHMFSKGASSFNDAYPELRTPNLAYQSNNKYMNFPPIMNDGRSVHSSWQPGAVVDELIRTENNIHSNWQYRKYLVENSEEIKNHNFKQSCNDVGYFIRNENKQVDSGMQGRIGIGEPVTRVNTSDLKQMYMSREQLHANQVIPSMTQEDIMKNWGKLFNIQK